MHNPMLDRLADVLARGQTIVTVLSVDQAKAQLADAKALRRADKGSEADVLRIEALVAQSEFTAAEAKSLEVVAEQRLRVMLHAKPERTLSIGVDVLAKPPIPALPSVDDLVAEALRNRLEIRSTDMATTSAYLSGLAKLDLSDGRSLITPLVLALLTLAIDVPQAISGEELRWARMPRLARVSLAAVMITLLLASHDTGQPFIYFQF